MDGVNNERGQALYDIFNAHIEQLDKNGLSIIDAATGYGKSYQIERYIRQNYQNKKFIFLAPQKKLFLGINNSIPKSSAELMSINIIPAFETFKKFFDTIKNDDILNKIKNVEEIRQITLKMKSANNDDIEFYREIFNKEEKNFRKELKKALIEDPSFKRNYKKEGLDSYNKVEILDFFTKYDWIVKLYPSVLAPFADLIQMTIHKAYYPIDTLWYGQHEISNRLDNLFKNYIIFIDEFDSTKEALLSIIISNITNQDRVNLFKTITYIYTSLNNICSTKNNHSILPKKFFGDKQEEFEKRIYDFYNDIKDDYTKYHLDSTIKYLDNENKEQFLFRDKQVLYIYDNKNRGKLTINFSEEENCNILQLSNKDENLFQEISNFISQKIDDFMILIAEISKNFFEYKQKTRKSGDETYSLYDSVCTIINEFNIGKSNEEYYSKVVYKYLTYTLKLAKDDAGEFLDTGFKYFFFENNSAHDLSTNVYYYHYNELPEHFLIGMAQSNIVMGLSATATLDTYVKNYDMHYLSKKLKDHFIQINSGELDNLKEEFSKTETRGHDVKVEIVDDNTELSTEKENLKYNLITIDESYQNISDKYFNIFNIQEIGNKTYRLSTYYNLIEAFHTFVKNQVHGMICFLNFKINYATELNFELFKNLLTEIASLKKYECQIFAIDSDDFDSRYEKVKEVLKTDMNVFIISTYKTLSLGKNLQYEFEGVERDLDGIYLDKLTNILPSVEMNDEKTLAEYLYSMEYLKAEGIIKTRKEFMGHLKDGFKKYLTGQVDSLSKKYAVDEEDAIISKYVIQAVGRICRTQNKLSNVCIVMHQKIKETLIRKKSILKNRMINYEFNKILDKVPDTDKCTLASQKYIIENNANNKNASKTITYLSYNWWTDLKMKEWIELREYVLKHPTEKNVEKGYEKYYCKFDKEVNSYAYQEKRLSNNGLEIFNITDTALIDKYSNEVSIKSSRFKEMLKSKYVYKYCKEKGYAIEFENNNYILNPQTFKRIYKGAIGEIASKAILEANGIKVKEITESKEFEKFDFYNGEIYYDMKNWSKDFYKDKSEMIKKISKKANKVGAKCVFIINVLKNNYQDIHESIIENESIIYEIPWLYDSKNNLYNVEAIKKIKKEQIKYGDID